MTTSQFHNNWIGGVAVSLAAVFAPAAAQAATVYCPGTVAWQSTGTAPSSGRYVEVTNGAFPGKCFYQTGNLQAADYPTVAGAFGISPTSSFQLLDKNGTDGSAQGSLIPIPGNSTTGTWNLTSNLWTGYSSLYLGFHFGNGGGVLDSFVVQLDQGQMNGSWAFLAKNLPGTPKQDEEKTNGLSNYYLFGIANGSPPPGRVPEPGSLALVGLALLAAGAARRSLK